MHSISSSVSFKNKKMQAELKKITKNKFVLFKGLMPCETAQFLFGVFLQQLIFGI